MRKARIVFVAVCALTGSVWLLPESGSSAALESLLLALSLFVATVFLAVPLVLREGAGSLRVGWRWQLVVSAVGAIAIPSLLFLQGRQRFSDLMAVATAAGIPVVVAIASSSGGDGDLLQDGLMPGLLAMAGTMLVLPVALPQSPRGWQGFSFYLAGMGVAGVCSVWCHRELTKSPEGSRSVVVGASNTVVAAMAAVVVIATTGSGWNELGLLPGVPLLAAGVSATCLIGIILLLRWLPPQALASRFVFVPLLAAVEAFALMRPTLSWRTSLGALLMLAGGIGCWRAGNDRSSDRSMSLR